MRLWRGLVRSLYCDLGNVEQIVDLLGTIESNLPIPFVLIYQIEAVKQMAERHLMSKERRLFTVNGICQLLN